LVSGVASGIDVAQIAGSQGKTTIRAERLGSCMSMNECGKALYDQRTGLN
jgi:hypothetical protein